MDALGGQAKAELPLIRARAGRTNSGWVNWVRRRSKRTVMRKYRFETKGRCRFDMVAEHHTVEPTAPEKTRTAKAAVLARLADRK